MRDSFCKTGDRKAGKAGSGTEWGREPGLDTGSAGETWMILKIGSYRGNRTTPAVFPLPGERETAS
ncbi:hypothetical protein [uncultured Sphingobacterium sp.]|uniref:hypothetical protein n=1 Tax=uncultured Sphingobacterium sp. TaxID=182688 RepID=UPI00259293F8|nr:hypothetical protein [uncultured Sphingobacterium sp.]